MQSQRGVTLGSLIVYVILVLIILGILVTITTNFRSGIAKINEEGTQNIYIDNFNIYFLKEVKKSGNKISEITNPTTTNPEMEWSIKFATNNKYSYNSTEKAIYLNDNIKIAEDIIKCEFSSSNVDGKTVITVVIQAKKSAERTIEYILNDETLNSDYEDENEYITNTTT